MSPEVSQSWSHRLAWLMAVLALLPITVGAVVTTVEAGMAFADWPTSDGVGLLAYPWLKSSGDKFLEHGHRLAGMLIGIVSLIFTGWAFAADHRPLVRRLAVAVLLGVIAQGIIGGIRVRQNDDIWALVHGHTAAWVFTAMCVTVLATGKRGGDLSDAVRPRTGLLIAAGASFCSVFVQVLLGGQLRHLGSSHAWLVHPWFAIAVVASVLAVHYLAGRQDLPRIQTSAQIALWLVLGQAALGLLTWGAKFGYPEWEILAVRQSPAQIALSTLHQVVGLLTFAAIGVNFLQVLVACRRPREIKDTNPIGALLTASTGGAA
ncbi:MAG: COX15/CtaA family protein [Planctomycetaceae bacterium]